MSLADIECKVKGQKNAGFAATPNGTSDLHQVENHIPPANLHVSSVCEAYTPDTPCKVYILLNERRLFNHLLVSFFSSHNLDFAMKLFELK